MNGAGHSILAQHNFTSVEWGEVIKGCTKLTFSGKSSHSNSTSVRIPSLTDNTFLSLYLYSLLYFACLESGLSV